MNNFHTNIKKTKQTRCSQFNSGWCKHAIYPHDGLWLQGCKHIKDIKALKIASWLQFNRNIKVLRTLQTKSDCVATLILKIYKKVVTRIEM